ncbi:MAG TPA: MFS transporter [Desulfocapsa sulfexigens]|nr:MFS transporter [Desulfocapsa sulfexigens]
MVEDTGVNKGKMDMLKVWIHPRVITMLFLGFSAGVPILLIFSTLSVWLREAGVSRSAVTFFSWAALGYSFKFIWAPLVDKLPLPFLTRMFGRRRSWMLLSQFSVMTAIAWMGFTDPTSGESSLVFMALAAVFLGFSSATQDIVIDAYRIECVDESLQAMLASTYVAGYRIGMLVAGAGSLYIASWFGTTRELYDVSAWRMTYFIMAGVMLVGVITTCVIDEPEQTGKTAYQYTARQYIRFFLLFLLVAAVFASCFFLTASFGQTVKEQLAGSAGVHSKVVGFFVETVRLFFSLTVAGGAALLAVKAGFADRDMVEESYVEPVRDFFVRYGGKTALLLLFLVGFYRVSDIVLGVVSNVFYLDMGFSKNVIATVTKTFGLLMTLAGGFLGGMLTVRFGVYRILFLGGVLAAATNLLFMLLARSGNDITLLTVVIGADNLCAGLASTAFVAFLSSLTNISFTAVQYALFSSLMTLFPKLIGGYSGTAVSAYGYDTFFLMTAAMGIPVLVLVWLAGRLVTEQT